MANQISKEKQRLNLVIEKKLVAQLDAEAQRTGRSRSDVIVAAIREHLRIAPVPASAEAIDAVKTKLEALEAQQTASTTLLVEAIKSQPIAIQEAPQPAALPAPEEEYEKTWFGLYRKKKG